MEAIFHPVTGSTIGTVERSPESGLIFAQVVDGDDDYKELSELKSFTRKRSAESWIIRTWKSLHSNN